jgi:hypothetical protein
MRLATVDLAQQAAPSSPASGWQRLHVRSDDRLHGLRSTGQDLDCAAVLGPTYVRKPSDTSTTSNILADLPGLSFAVAAGAQYLFEFVGTVASNTLANAIYVAVNGPTLGANGIIYHSYTPAATTTKRLDTDTAYDQPHGPGASGATGTRTGWRTWGYVHIAASGTLTMRYRSNVAGDTTTVHAGAHGLLWQVGDPN